MKKLLVTGINGFIGNAAKRFFDGRYDIYGIDAVGNDDGKTCIMDMRSEKLTGLLAKIKPDIVIHAAGGSSVSLSVENPQKDFDSSVAVFYALLEGMRKANKESIIVFLSSAAVYGNPKKIPISENAGLTPISPYGLHKKMCEEMAAYYRSIYGMDIRILRIFSVYGQGLKKQIMWDMFQKYVRTGRIELFGTGREARDFIHIDDLMQILGIIINADAGDEAFVLNVANGKAVTIREISNIFSELLCGENKVLFNNKERSGDPDVWEADISRISGLGYRKKILLEQGIKDYIEWVRNI